MGASSPTRIFTAASTGSYYPASGTSLATPLVAGAAALLLENFLRIRRSTAVEHRAHFYLGQMYYLTGRYREALLEFLLARDSYYRPSEDWMADCFRRLWQTD